MGDSMIDVTKDGDIIIITINNPPMNVLNGALLRELDGVLDQMVEDPALGVIITGEGRAFVAGADIKEMCEMSPDEALGFANLGQSVFNKIEQLPKPVIAAVNGFALGGGTELAMSCDIRIASGAAKFGQPEVNLAVIPGFGGTQRLPRLVGAGKAKELIYTGDIIGAEEALRIGLVQKLVDGYEKDESGELVKNEKGRPVQDNGPVVNAALDMMKKISSKGPLAIRSSKRSIHDGLNMTLSEGLRYEAEQFADLFATLDQKEGMDAFVNKRKPDFKSE